MIETIVFLLSILYRFLSGMQNGSGYKGEIFKVLLFSLAICVTCNLIVETGLLKSHTACIQGFCLFIPNWIGNLLMFISAASAAGMAGVFIFSASYKWIHPLETVITGTFTIALALYYPIWAVLGVYPGLVLHTIGKNWMQGLPWNYYGTDDETGKTWTFPILGLDIPIPRIPFAARFIAAAFSIVGYVIAMDRKKEND